MIRETLVHSHTDCLKRIEQDSEPDDDCTEVANDSQMFSRGQSPRVPLPGIYEEVAQREQIKGKLNIPFRLNLTYVPRE